MSSSIDCGRSRTIVTAGGAVMGSASYTRIRIDDRSVNVSKLQQLVKNNKFNFESYEIFMFLDFLHYYQLIYGNIIQL